MGKYRWLSFALYLTSLLLYVGLAYYTPRSNFLQLILLYSLLFGCYLWIIKNPGTRFNDSIGAAVLFRLALIALIPAFSDDIFRFVWDGRLLAAGENPYQHLPLYYLQHPELNIPGIHQTLFNELNSPRYYSVYPPLTQFVNGLASWFFPTNILGSIVLLRAILILVDIGNIYVIGKILHFLGIPRRAVLLYALNPLVIIELTGNLHFEGLMLLFILLAIWLLFNNRMLLSAGSFALAVSVKLIPLIFLPFLIKRLGWQRSLVYFGIVGTVVILLFLPFLSQALLANFFSSINLYFQTFEFNASIYYVIRSLGYLMLGYNVIGIAGKVLPLLALFGILFLAYRQNTKDWDVWFKAMLFALSIYFFLASIVHPWYICSLVLFSVFTPYRFAVIWSMVIPLSYATYAYFPYQENLWLVGFEYAVVAAWMSYEFWLRLKWRKVERLVGSGFNG